MSQRTIRKNTDPKGYALERMKANFLEISTENLAYSPELRKISVLTYARFIQDVEKIPQEAVDRKRRYIASKMIEAPRGEHLLDFLMLYYAMKRNERPVDATLVNLLRDFKKALPVAAHLLDRPDKQEDNLTRSLFAYRVKRDGTGKLPPIAGAKGKTSDIFKELPALGQYRPSPSFTPSGVRKGIRELSERDLQLLSSVASFCSDVNVGHFLTETILEELMTKKENEGLEPYTDMLAEYFLTEGFKEHTKGKLYSPLKEYDNEKGASARAFSLRYLALYQEISILEAKRDREITRLVNENKAKPLDERLSKAAMRHKLRKNLAELKQEISKKKVKLLHESVFSKKGLSAMSMTWLEDTYRDLFYEIFIGHEVLKILLEKEIYAKLEEEDLL